jgi:acyl-CoA oxidase
MVKAEWQQYHLPFAPSPPVCAGNNAVEMQTTAHYDTVTQEFIIHTPTTLAQKYWITNSAVHAQWSVVFAQLFINGTNHGIHGFLVR